MANRWETMETVRDFIFLGSKIIADGDYSHELKRCLLLRRKTVTNLDSILKSRDITLPTKVNKVKAMVFSSSHVWMWELDYKESWAPKNWCFWIVVLEKTLESASDCKEIQSILKEISPEYSLEGLMLKLKLQYFGHLMWRTDSSEKTLILGKIDGRRRRGWQRKGVGDGQGGLACCSPWGHKQSDTSEQLNWTVKGIRREQETKGKNVILWVP